MRILTLVITIFLVVSFLSSTAKAQTERLDNLAACAGVVIGNGAVDFYLGDEEAFNIAANIAYSAYLSEVFSREYQQNDLQVADQILGGNVDKIIVAHNSENFTSDVYEEVVTCYRTLAKQLIEGAETIINNHNLLSHFARSNKKELEEKNIEILCKKGQQGKASLMVGPSPGTIQAFDANMLVRTSMIAATNK